MLTLGADEWRTGSVVLRESGTRPSNASAFTPGDRLVLSEQPGENASIFADGATYVVAVVDVEGGRMLGRDTVVLD